MTRDEVNEYADVYSEYLARSIRETQPLTNNDDREAVKTWIDALRSGKFDQTDAVLFSNNKKSFCCLGVYCNVVNNIPTQTLEGLSMPWEIPSVQVTLPFSKAVTKFFAELNDDARLNFGEIADVAEVLLLGNETKEAAHV